MNKVFIVLIKDLWIRKNRFLLTGFEVFFPIIMIFALNMTPFPEAGPIYNEFMDNTIQKSCHKDIDIFLRVSYEPSTDFTRNLMSKVKCLGGFHDVLPGKVHGKDASFTVGVVFNGLLSNTSDIPDVLDYELYPTTKYWKDINQLWREPSLNIPRYSSGSLEKFFRLQHAINDAFLQIKGINTPKISFQNMDLTDYSSNIRKIIVMGAFFFSFSFMLPGTIGILVEDKSSGANELLLTMGLKRWHLWFSKLLECLIVFGIVQIFIVCLLYIPLRENSQVFTVFSPFLMWTFLMYALTGVIIFLFFLSSIFTDSTLAVVISGVVWLLSFLLFIIFENYPALFSKSVWMLFSLLPYFSFYNGLSILLDYDYYGKTVKCSEILSGQKHYPTLCNILIMMFINIILYFILTWYLAQVRPGKFGIPKSYGFCFQKSYWFRQQVKVENIELSCIHPRSSEPLPRGREDFEPPLHEDMKTGISIRNVKKEYTSLSKCSVIAIENINIDFYYGEISALLGHNGAGKTTLFSIISGLTYATSGTVWIAGYDVAKNTEEARANLGICPQNDMLFEKLNTIQTLRFFSMIKGLSWKEASSEVGNIIRKLKLNDVKKTVASKLSGGQKRKLSLGIALIGGSSIILLDEPTSGLDPEMRREIWDILLDFRRSDRTILLITHFMEEADAVCDRIAVMNLGKIRCYGTPMYLKSKYGSGYTLSIVVKNSDRIQEISKLVPTIVKGAKFKSENVLTLAYKLPQEDITNFPLLFAKLNELQDSGEIQTFSVAYSTFEDVFIRLGDDSAIVDMEDNVDSSPYKILRQNSNKSVNLQRSPVVLNFYQFFALLIKKIIYLRRHYFSFLIFQLIPLLIIITKFSIMPLVFGNGSNVTRNNRGLEGTLTYSLELYNGSTVLYSTRPGDEVSKAFTEYVLKLGSKPVLVEYIEKEVEKIFMNDFYLYMRETNLGVDFNKNWIKIFHNSYATHMMPISLNVVYNSLLLAYNMTGSIKTSVNLMYSYRESELVTLLMDDSVDSFETCFASEIPDYIFIQVIFYLIGPMSEKKYGAKHLQLMITSTALYWFSHLLFDLAVFLPYLCICLTVIGTSTQQNIFSNNYGEILLASILWGSGMILLVYFISTFSTNKFIASGLSLTLNFFFTFFIINLVEWDLWPEEVLYLHPSSILKSGLGALCENDRDSYKTALFIYNITLYILLITKESEILSNLTHRIVSNILVVDYSSTFEKNETVKNQEEHVRHLRLKRSFSMNSLIVDDLKRWFLDDSLKAKGVVNGISFNIEHGECFGLLGVNGAGKTTTFKMMTGAITASHGKIVVNGYKLFSLLNKSKGLFQIGYCPQHGGLIPSFKAQELLALFARLRGVQRNFVGTETRKWMEVLEITEHSNTPVEHYSGGNQRKLLVGMALIGDPSVILLDEPTSGVDPVSRRVIWKIISNLRKSGKSVLLTSHSMDECEALCSRLAIMVKGHLRCCGEIPTLKETFGQGIIVQLKCKSRVLEDIDAIKNAMKVKFGRECTLIDHHWTILEYLIKDKTLRWDTLFTNLIYIKENFAMVESFTASATSLEQIFISFARE